MARPTNAGLDYFPLDTDIDQDDKLALVEADFGIKGFGIVIKLLMKIYATSYYYDWGEKEQKLFSRRVNVDINYLSEVVNATFKWEVFDNELYKKHGILTSRGVQKRYFEACVRRKEVEVSKNYLLLTQNEVEKYKNIVYVDINPRSAVPNVNINYNSLDENVHSGTQSKVKESKVKESKGNNSSTEEKNTPAADPISKINAHEFYQNNFGVENPTIMQSIDYWIDDLSEELVIEAMRRAAIDQKGFRYAEGIMKNWDKKNIRTIDQVEAEDVAFANQNKKKPSYSKQPVRKETLPDWAQEEYMPPETKSEWTAEKEEEFQKLARGEYPEELGK